MVNKVTMKTSVPSCVESVACLWLWRRRRSMRETTNNARRKGNGNGDGDGVEGTHKQRLQTCCH